METAMTTRRLTQATVGAVPFAMLVFVLATALAVLPSPAHAAVTCPGGAADFDGDGLTDAEECLGVQLLDGTVVPLDPNKKDVFLIVVPTSPSRLPANPAEFISNSPPAGLDVTPHIVTSAQINPDTRLVTPTQKAIKMTESSELNTDSAGQCNYGTPDDPALCIVFSQRIATSVRNTYTQFQPNADPAVIAQVIDRYQKHTFAHEASHSMRVTKQTYDRCTGGTHHYKSGTNTIMDCQVIYTVKGGVITWTIGTTYTGTDPADITLTTP